MRSFNSFLYATVLAFAALALPCAAAGADARACTDPDASAVWWDSRNGSLVALSCSGQPLDWIDIGSIRSLAPMRIAGFDAPVVKAGYLAGAGSSGYRHERTSVFALVDGRIVELWGHETYFSGFRLCESWDEAQVDVEVSTDGLHIHTNGFRRTTFGEWREEEADCAVVAIEQQRFAAGSVCWNGGAYVECDR